MASEIKLRPYPEQGDRPPPATELDEFEKGMREAVKVELLGGGSYPLNGVTIQVSAGGKLLKVIEPNELEWRELYGINWREFDNLTGRLLTLCDATFTDPVQRKAFKDMVRQHIKEWANSIAVDAAHDAGFELHSTAPFVGGVFDRPGGLFGIEGQPTD